MGHGYSYSIQKLQMATASEGTAIKRALDFLASKGKPVFLKYEQELAVRHMLRGEDVLAVLPTGFGKSLIFTVFGIAEKEKTKGAPVSVLVICPLKSIISDQLDELEGICSAAELTNESLGSILEDPPDFIYCSAEQALEARFLEALKDQSSKIHQRIAAIVVDESHTVETWTGMR